MHNTNKDFQANISRVRIILASMGKGKTNKDLFYLLNSNFYPKTSFLSLMFHFNSDLRFTKDDFIIFLNHCDFDFKDEFNDNYLMLLLKYNKEKNINMGPDDIYSFIDKFKLDDENNDRWNILNFILRHNDNNNINFSNLQIVSLILKMGGLDRKDVNGWTPMMYLLSQNNNEKLNFTHKSIVSLLEKVDYKNDSSLINFILKNNKSQNLGFSGEEIIDIINNFIKNKTRRDIEIMNLVRYIIKYNVEEDLFIPKEKMLDLFKLESVSGNHLLIKTLIETMYENRGFFDVNDLKTLIGDRKMNDSCLLSLLSNNRYETIGISKYEILKTIKELDFNDSKQFASFYYNFFNFINTNDNDFFSKNMVNIYNSLNQEEQKIFYSTIKHFINQNEDCFVIRKFLDKLEDVKVENLLKRI